MISSLISTTPPPDFFSSSVWQFLSGIGAIIAIPIAIIATITAVLAYRRQKKHKVLAYQVISDVPIASIDEVVEDKIEVLINGQPVKYPRLLVLKIQNSGNVSIKPEDYFNPIKFEFEKSSVIASHIIGTTPPDLLETDELDTFLISTPNSVELPKYPLNPGDTITSTILLDGKSQITSKGRINEGHIIDFIRQPTSIIKDNKKIAYLATFILFILASILGIVIRIEALPAFIIFSALVSFPMYFVFYYSGVGMDKIIEFFMRK